jgi:UDP-N-acetylmuramoyl-tripeptide--D-alanyl-D-alanine ligase
LQPALYVVAFIWRRLLLRTTFIAVTGSLGKTTAKECLAAVLASRGSTFRSYRNQNAAGAVVLNVLRVRPWHRSAVLEMAAASPKSMRRFARLVRPDVAIVLNVLRTHTTTFRDLDEHAAEKSLLLSAMSSRGLAVLNSDDPLVKCMAGGVERRAVLFGTTADCDYQAEQISAGWPRRLTFVVRHKSFVQPVATQLYIAS